MSDDCILWQGAVGSDGYGKQKVKGTRLTRGAHRIAYAEANGINVLEIPRDAVVMHRCDVRLCINPAHLTLGSHADNMRDALNKGRLVTPHQFHNEHCRQGHDTTQTGVYVDKRGRRRCAECVKENARGHHARLAG